MLTSKLLGAASLAAALLLAGCGEPETIVAGGTPDDQQAELNAAPAVELPPAMTASKSLRCKDGSVAFIDFFAGDKQAIVRLGKRDASPVTLKAAEAGQPLTAEGGYSLTGTASDQSVTLASPGKPAQSCKA